MGIVTAIKGRTMMTLAALILVLAGFGSLALSMHKHHRDQFGTPPPRGRAIAFQTVGWTLLAASIAPCVAGSGWSIGLVLWVGLLPVAALVVALTLTYAPKGTPRREGPASRS